MSSTAELIPSVDQLFRLAPLTTIILCIAAIGFVAGWRSRQGHIDSLKDWLNDFRNRPKRTHKDEHDVDD